MNYNYLYQVINCCVVAFDKNFCVVFQVYINLLLIDTIVNKSSSFIKIPCFAYVFI